MQRNTQSNLGRDIPILSNVLGMAATHYTTPMLEQFVDNAIFIEDNIFFSRSYIMLGEERIDLAIGIGGQVYEMTDFQDKLNKVLGVSDLLETIGLQDKIKAKSN